MAYQPIGVSYTPIFSIAVMPLVPEKNMADTRKHSVSGTHWPGEPRG